MNRKKHLIQYFETAAITAAILLVNLIFFPDDPGFSELLFTPFITAALFSAVYYGRRFGFFSLLVSTTATAALILNTITIAPGFLQKTMIILASSVFLVYLFGTIAMMDHLKTNRTRERLKILVKENYRLKKITSAQLEINRELEERVTRQRPTITTLYNQMHRMDSLNLGRSLDILIETVQLFTEATDVTIWKRSTAEGFLTSASSIHKSSSFDSSKLLNIDNSIEGWVFRNNRIVSARMINNYEHLKKMDTGRNLITIPIPINKKIWGVLNIEEMPFVRYNHYTEKLLEIIISLAEPSLSRAIEHEHQIHQSETDNDTGLPLFSQLFTMLNRNIHASTENKARMSLLIVEIHNYQELCNEFPSAGVKKLFLKMIDDVQMATAGMAEFFMHKSDNQMAIMVPGVDGDGAALLCLEILELVNKSNWIINGREAFLEIIIGYSSLGENASDAEGLVRHAEHLLEIQKL